MFLTVNDVELGGSLHTGMQSRHDLSVFVFVFFLFVSVCVFVYVCVCLIFGSLGHVHNRIFSGLRLAGLSSRKSKQ